MPSTPSVPDDQMDQSEISERLSDCQKAEGANPQRLELITSWLRRWESNPRPSGYEPDELPLLLRRNFIEPHLNKRVKPELDRLEN